MADQSTITNSELKRSAPSRLDTLTSSLRTPRGSMLLLVLAAV